VKWGNASAWSRKFQEVDWVWEWGWGSGSGSPGKWLGR